MRIVLSNTSSNKYVQKLFSLIPLKNTTLQNTRCKQSQNLSINYTSPNDRWNKIKRSIVGAEVKEAHLQIRKYFRQRQRRLNRIKVSKMTSALGSPRNRTRRLVQLVDRYDRSTDE